jgi:hypothetical protein
MPLHQLVVNVMDRSTLLTRLRSVRINRHLALAAAVAISFATAAVVYGILHDDVVTAISALPFVPAAFLLIAIGLSFDRPDERQSGPGGTV